MSYQEKQTIVSIVASLAFLAAYGSYAYGQFSSGAVDPNDLRSWAGVMLVFIALGIVAMIVIQIVFHILLSIGIAVQKTIEDQSTAEQEIDRSIKAEFVEDERDRLIGLKSMRVGMLTSGLGFVASLVSLVLGASPVLMLNILFFSFFAGSVLDGFAHLYYYRQGV
jgi:hypothetical protein